MKRMLMIALGATLLVAANRARADDDPFAGDGDSLAIKPSADGSASVRAGAARRAFEALPPDVVLVKVTGLDDRRYPFCTFTGQVLTPATSTEKRFKLMAKDRRYRFAPVLKKKGAELDLDDLVTRRNLGACYYPPGTLLQVKVSDVDLKAKTFTAATLARP
jgi:hypothetical protein